MNYATINAKTDPTLKKNATELADSLGISLSIVINNALRNFVAERKLVISEDYVPNAYLKKSIKTAENQLAKDDFFRTKNKADISNLIDSL